MTCLSCQQRREMMKRRAMQISRPAKSEVNTRQTVPARSCAGCMSKATPQGWVNVCPLCFAQSDAKPTPHTGQPKCAENCNRLTENQK